MSDEEFKKLADVGSIEVGKFEFTVILYQYRDGDPKIKAQRTGKKKDGTAYFSDIGNLTADEAAALAPLLVKAAADLRALPK